MLKRDAKQITFISQWGSDTKGVNAGNVKKVLAQINTFKKAGYTVNEVIKEIPKYTDHPTIWDRIISKSKNILPFCTNQARIKYSDVGKADCYYIRFRGYDYFFRKLLVEIKKNNPDSKVVLEYSDYPYIEYKGRDVIGDFLVKTRDDYEKKKCAKYIDRIATLLAIDEIDGVRCLRIRNGLNVDSIKTRKPRVPDNSIHILIVASLQRVHGVDLFINGMKKYYKEEHVETVYLHVVGGGEVVRSLKNEAIELGDKVVFHGFLFEEDLDEIYNCCDLGIEFLAPHRKQITISASLKSREYIARGMPFVSACELDISDLGFDDYLKIDDGESPIDINRIVDYYHSFCDDIPSKIHTMRTFAEKYLGMDYAMKEVTTYFGD